MKACFKMELLSSLIQDHGPEPLSTLWPAAPPGRGPEAGSWLGSRARTRCLQSSALWRADETQVALPPFPSLTSGVFLCSGRWRLAIITRVRSVLTAAAGLCPRARGRALWWPLRCLVSPGRSAVALGTRLCCVPCRADSVPCWLAWWQTGRGAALLPSVAVVRSLARSFTHGFSALS